MGQFQRIKYPDGQISAKLIHGGGVDSITIKERINSYEDLMYIRAIGDILDKQLIFKKLFIPCLFGQRSDRRFDELQSFDLKLIAEVINNCNFNTVEIFDPHSDVALALINNSVKKSSFEYAGKAAGDILHSQLMDDGHMTDLLLVSPDAGAYKKVFEFGERLNIPVMGAMKHRDKDGTVSISFTHDIEGKDCLIVDDLCDGGATFITLAKILKLHKARKVYLYVSHGIFSKGFLAMKQAGIEHIYTTNSVRDIPADSQTCNQLEIDFVTQYKVV